MSLVPTGGTTITLHLSGVPQVVAGAKAASVAVAGVSTTAKRSFGSFIGLNAFKRGLSDIYGLAKKAVIGLAALGAAGVALGVSFYKAGANALKTQTRFNEVFQGTGEEALNFLTQMNDKFGVGLQTLQNGAASFGVLGRAAGLANDKLAPFSDSLVQAGLDMASFFNADPAKVFAALQSGLAGQVRALRPYGIFLSQTALAQQAALHGLTGPVTKLSDQQKILLRQEIIMRQLGKSSGDLAKNIDSPANQLRMFSGRVADLRRAIGIGLIPIFSTWVQQINKKLPDALKFVNRYMPTFQRIAGKGVIDTIRRFVDLWKTVSGGHATLHDIAVKIDNIFGGTGVFTKSVEHALKIGGDLLVIWRDDIWPLIEGVGGVIKWIDPLQKISDITGFLAKHSEGLHNILGPLATDVAIYTAAAWGAAAATAAWNAVLDLNPFVLIIASIITAEIWLNKHHKTFHFLQRDIQQLKAAWHGLESVGRVFQRIGNAFKNDVWDPFIRFKHWIDHTFNPEIEKWNKRFDDIFGAIGRLPGNVKDALSNAWDGVWDGLKTGFFTAMNAIIDGWNSIGFKLPSFGGFSIKGHTVIPGFEGPSLNVPHIDHVGGLETGGMTTSAGLIRVGERGTEVLHLPQAASVAPLPRSQTLPSFMGSMGGGGDIPPLNLYIDGKQVQVAVRKATANKEARR